MHAAMDLDAIRMHRAWVEMTRAAIMPASAIKDILAMVSHVPMSTNVLEMSAMLTLHVAIQRDLSNAHAIRDFMRTVLCVKTQTNVQQVMTVTRITQLARTQ